MKAHLVRVLFVIVLFGLLLLKQTPQLCVGIVFLWAAAYRNWRQLNNSVLKSIFLFNAGISIGYLIEGLFREMDVLPFLLYINLKVYALTFFVMWFFSKVDMIRFFAFSKELSYLLSISLSQIISYKKSYEDFKFAFRARVIRKLRNMQKKFIVMVFGFFFEKALHDAGERTLAMKARGAFD